MKCYSSPPVTTLTAEATDAGGNMGSLRGPRAFMLATSIAAMVERVAGGKSLAAALLERIVAKTDGVPLFVEELTRAVLETGLLKDAGGSYVLSGPLPSLEIPATLQDSLMARLDRLAPDPNATQGRARIARFNGQAAGRDVVNRLNCKLLLSRLEMYWKAVADTLSNLRSALR